MYREIKERAVMETKNGIDSHFTAGPVHRFSSVQ